MMEPIIINDIRLPPGHNERDLAELAARRSGLSVQAVLDAGWRIVRKSVDARRNPRIYLLYSVLIGGGAPVLAGIDNLIQHKAYAPDRPVVAGAGPAGLFAALALAIAGQKPLVIEQGKQVEQRQIDVARFWQTGKLDPFSNVQFGEGGAGTFSDGKLTTGVKDPRCRAVLEEMVLAGAPEEILFLARPHVGTDHLRRVVQGLREKIIRFGGEFRFSCRLDGLQHAAGRLTGLILASQSAAGEMIFEERAASRLILAVGHSARPTFEWLNKLPLILQAKPFSLGVRIEHLQSEINSSQYGSVNKAAQLPPADYKLVCHLPRGRSVYTFCMCPGGQVVAAASEAGGVVTNGMSHFARDHVNANCALLVGADPSDFPEAGPLGGIYWQQAIEGKAYRLAGGGYRAPAQRLGSFMRHQTNLKKQAEDHLKPSYEPGVSWCELGDCLPDFVYSALQESLPILERKLAGFSSPDAILTGVETRSSSPLRILRDNNLQASIRGVFPCGEGAGYAGGIVSAAADGIRCAQAAVGLNN